MKIYFKFTLTLGLAILLTLGACSRSANPPTSAPRLPTAAPLPVQAESVEPEEAQQPTPTPTETIQELPTPEPGSVVFDFVTAACQATWANNLIYLPCPGDLNYLDIGYVGVLESTSLTNGLQMTTTSLLTIPAQNENYTGVFGRYPPFTVQPGDHFKTALGCMPSPEGTCDLVYSLQYYDMNGGFHDLAGAENLEGISASQPGGRLLLVDFPLDEVAGQTVEFVLSIQDNGNPIGDNALWIAPYVWREPSLAAVTTTQTPGTASSGYEGYIDPSVGIISGKTDMTNAPEHLRDDYGWSSPVALVFFNLDDGTYWYMQDIWTHPDFQMTVPPGRYHAMAYSYSLDGTESVSAAYTGKNPSCDETLAEVTVPPGGFVGGILINDWNWKCSGTAERPAKPPEVIIPY